MKTKEEQIEEKKIAIEKLQKEQFDCLKKCLDMATRQSSKYRMVNLKRMVRVLAYSMRIKQIQMQINLIISQPIQIKDFPSGGIAIVGESKREIILPNIN